MRHDFAVRRIWTFAALAALFCAGCTSSSGGSTPPPSSPPPVSTTAPPATPTSSQATHTSSFSGPPRVTQPTLPADVPTTGPNTKAGEKPPIMPLEATQHTADGAKAFAEFFIKTIDWGYATTSSAYMRHYFLKSCQGCRIFADAIDAAKRKGHSFVGGRFAVQSSETKSLKASVATVGVTADNSSFEELDKNGKFVRADIAHKGERFTLTIRWVNSAWRVSSQEIVA